MVLPAASFAEKDGTFTNTERRVQRVRAAVPSPGEARADWAIIAELARRLGGAGGWDYAHPADIMAEIDALTPSYAGITYERLDAEGGLQWPCPDTTHPGTPILHIGRFTRGKGKFFPDRLRGAGGGGRRRLPAHAHHGPHARALPYPAP